MLPILQPAGLLQPGREQIAREVDHLPSRQVPAQKLQTGFVELVRFVEDHRLHGRQQLRHTGLAHRQVGKEKMVVDHHHIRGKRLAPRQVDVAGAKLRTWRTQAILARRRYMRQQGRALVQPGQLGQVSAFGGVRPLFDLGQNAGRGAIEQQRILPRQLHPVQAQIAASAFEQGAAYRQAKCLYKLRQVAPEQLVLQGLGGGGQQHPCTAEQGRYQIRKGLANTGARLYHQCSTVSYSACDGARHFSLASTRAELFDRTRQGAARGERLLHLILQTHFEPVQVRQVRWVTTESGSGISRLSARGAAS